MTNYNKRLDEILDIFHNKMLALETITDPRDEPGDEIDRTFDGAKQAINTLILEQIIGKEESDNGYDMIIERMIKDKQRARMK